MRNAPYLQSRPYEPCFGGGTEETRYPGIADETGSRGGISPVWSPAGDQFIYTDADTLHLVDCASAKDSELIRLAKLRSVGGKASTSRHFRLDQPSRGRRTGAVVSLRQRTAGQRGRRPFHRPRRDELRLSPNSPPPPKWSRTPSSRPTANWSVSAAATISTSCASMTAS